MFRKSLFLGLTVMLAAVFAYLVFQGRQQEKLIQNPPRTVEVIRESTPSLTRVIAPMDLELVESKMEIAPAASQAGHAEPPGLTATHRMVIRNSGTAAYRKLAFRISYLGRGDKVLETRMIQAAEALRAGETRSIAEIKAENIPARTERCTAKIAYADLEPTPAKP